MVDINSVCISGRVLADAVTKMTSSGKEFTSFGIASNDDYKSKSGEWVNKANFINCVYWKAQVLKKGEPVIIYGKLETNTEDYNGSKRTYTKINVNKIFKLNIEKKGGAINTTTQNVEGSNEVVNSNENNVVDDDEEIPF